MRLIQEYPILIPFAAILLAEIAKMTIDLIRRRARIRFIKPGGMPSGHSAFVTALAVTVAYREGVASTLFMISAVVGVIVMYDAINLRNEAGKHAAALNKLQKGSKLEESLGHNHWEVVVGAVFGAVVAYALLTV